MDKIGSNTTQHRGPTVGSSEKNRKRLYTITPEGDKMPFHVTVCLTTRSDGQYGVPGNSISDGAPPPVIIHSRKGEDRDPEDVCDRLKTCLVNIDGTSGCSKIEDAFKQNDKHGFLVLATPNGSMTQSAMLPFARHFVNNLPTNRLKDEPVILFLDGHSSRWDISTLNFFFENNVFPFLLPSHTSIWSQPNDCGPNKRLHGCISEANRQLRSTRIDKNFQPKHWNQIFRNGWELFLTREQNDFRINGSNTASFAYVKTGLEPFNPKPSSWQDAISTIGMTYIGRHGKYARSYDVIPRDSVSTQDLSPSEIKTITEDYHSINSIWTENEQICLAARECAKGMLHRWRNAFDEKRSLLIKTEDVSVGGLRRGLVHSAERQKCQKQMHEWYGIKV
jgi:hypothetical protein